jgi:hypothetical protein
MAANQMETCSCTEDERVFDGTGSAVVAASNPRSPLEEQVADLRRALETQRTIGSLVGLLAGRWHCTVDQAWAAVVRVSQHTNVKVRDIARIYTAAHDGQDQDEHDEMILARLLVELPAPLKARTPPGTVGT